MPNSLERITEPSRLAAVGEVLQSLENRPEFDRLTGLAAKLLNVPTCLVSLVTDERQEFAGACGLPTDVAEIRGTPLSHSFCKLTVNSGELLRVDDAPEDDRVSDNPVITAMGLKAYLGFPLIDSTGNVLGAFCLIDYVPRKWTEVEIDAVRDFALLAIDMIEASVSKSRASAAFDVIVHDLRSPLTGILMTSSIFKERIESLPAQFHPLVGNLASAAEAAVVLIDTLSEKNRKLEEIHCEEPMDLLGRIVERFLPHADEKGIAFSLDCEDIPALAVPPWALRQVLENLVSNAVKYSPHGTRVLLGFECDGDEGIFTVSDEGPGFSEQDRLRMFQRYRRLSAKPTGNENSTGIGLSIVKRLADQNGGRVDLVSPPGSGAVFEVGFPLL